MIKLSYKITRMSILREYRTNSLKAMLTQKYMNKKRIAKDVRLLWNRNLRTISYN